MSFKIQFLISIDKFNLAFSVDFESVVKSCVFVRRVGSSSTAEAIKTSMTVQSSWPTCKSTTSAEIIYFLVFTKNIICENITCATAAKSSFNWSTVKRSFSTFESLWVVFWWTWVSNKIPSSRRLYKTSTSAVNLDGMPIFWYISLSTTWSNFIIPVSSFIKTSFTKTGISSIGGGSTCDKNRYSSIFIFYNKSSSTTALTNRPSLSKSNRYFLIL